MSSQTLGIIIGGLIPAILFGVGNTMVKSANNAGISLGFLILCFAFGAFCVGVITLMAVPNYEFSLAGGLYAIIFGLCMGTGSVLVSIAIVRHGTPVSVLAPLYNMNTLVAVLLSMWIFAEWQAVKAPQLLVGAVFIVIGGALVARA